MKVIFLLSLTFFYLNTSFSQNKNLSKMTEKARNEYLLEKSKEVILNFGPEWYREPMSVEISGLSVFNDETNKHPKIQKCNGRKYYTITYYYDKYYKDLNDRFKEVKGIIFAFKVFIWEDDGEPESILFGNAIGLTFLFRPYEDWVNNGVKKEDQKPFDKGHYDYFDKVLYGDINNFIDN